MPCIRRTDPFHLDEIVTRRGLKPARVYVYLYGGWLTETGEKSDDAQRLLGILSDYRTWKIAGARISIELGAVPNSTSARRTPAPPSRGSCARSCRSGWLQRETA